MHLGLGMKVVRHVVAVLPIWLGEYAIHRRKNWEGLVTVLESVLSTTASGTASLFCAVPGLADGDELMT